jgi:mRNA interferase RelE/StbE
MLKIDLSRQAADFLSELQAKQAKQIITRLDALAVDPSSVPSALIKGGKGERRAKAGEFRIVYEISGENLIVWLIDRRNDDRIYRKLRRL